jgi:hypothetical protein
MFHACNKAAQTEVVSRAATQMLRAALIYAQWFCFLIFPCHWILSGLCSCGQPDCQSPGKHPLTRNGFKDATCNLDVIRHWWTRWPFANLGIVTGGNRRVMVLDIDFRHFGNLSLEALEDQHGRLPATPIALTGGGLHIYLKLPVGVAIPCSSGLLGHGLDIRANDGYVIAPPSMHVSGRRYCWEWSARIDEMPIADASRDLIDFILNPPAVPDWMVDLIPNPTDYRQGASNGRHLPPGRVSFQSLAAGIPEGKRDVDLFRMACALRRQRFSRALAEQMVIIAASRCKPPVSARIARQKIKGAWRYV